MPPKRKCTFNSELQKDYPFMKKGRLDWEVICSKCSSTFSVAHGGKSDINDHLKSAKHKRADNAAASSMSAIRFFRSTILGD